MCAFIKTQKAQVSAPFEVLVAVILMGFVILAGTWALNNLSENTCIGDKRQELSELKEAITEVVLNSDLTTKNISFDIRPCFNQKYEYITIKSYENPTRCSAYCGGGNSCTLLEYRYDDTKVRRMPIDPICLNLPTAITCQTEIEKCYPDDETEQSEWQALDLTQLTNITSGKYRLFMIGSKEYGTQELCFLKKKKI